MAAPALVEVRGHRGVADDGPEDLLVEDGGLLPELGDDRGALAVRDGLLVEDLLRLGQHELLEHGGALRGDVRGARVLHLEGLVVAEERKGARGLLEAPAGVLDALGVRAVVGDGGLAVHGRHVEQRRRLLEVQVRLGRLLRGLEGVVPREAQLHVLLVGADREPGLHGAQGLVVVAQDVLEALRGRVLPDHAAPPPLHRLQVVHALRRVVVPVVELHELPHGALEVRGLALLAVHRQHHRVGARPRPTPHGGCSRPVLLRGALLFVLPRTPSSRPR